MRKKNCRSSLLLASTLMLLLSCQNEEPISPDLADKEFGPVSTRLSFFPTEGAEGTYVAVTGTAFSVTTNYNKVSFPVEGGGVATVGGRGYSSNKDTMWVIAPPKVVSGPFSVSVNDVKARTKDSFTIVTPEAGLKFSPKEGTVDKIIGLYGIPFSEKAHENAVSFEPGATNPERFLGQILRVDAENQILWVRMPSVLGSGKVVATIKGVTYASDQALEVVTCNATTLAGGIDGYADGVGRDAQFDFIPAMAVGPGGMVYIADAGNNRIRKLNPQTGEVSTLTGSSYGFADGTGTEAMFRSPSGVTVGHDGMLYVADSWNHRIRRIDPVSMEVTTVAGSDSRGTQDGIGEAAMLNEPERLTTASDGSIYFSEYSSSLIRRLNPSTGEVTTVAGNGATDGADGDAASASFGRPSGLTADGDSVLYIIDRINESIRKLDLVKMQVSTLVEGEHMFSLAGTEKQFPDNPKDVWMDAGNRVLYFVDSKILGMGALKSIDLESRIVTKVAGGRSRSEQENACISAVYNDLNSLVRLPDGSFLVSDMVDDVSYDYSIIRKIE